MNTVALGTIGETLALEYLKAQGLRCIARNYRAGHGEIDLIVTDNHTVIFVEVKARHSQSMGSPIEAVTPNKIRMLVATAQRYLLSHGFADTQVDIRFDIVVVDLETEQVEHILGAFTAADAGRRRHW